ncbi:hypothetical protein ACOT7R_16320 [Clostridium perfringens]|uniref:hypothetical protein n=1 Tax=Clostridium perfringens TaxID=1502 RepID=UPI003BABF1F1
MNIKNLTEGMEIKNYKELCNILEIKVTDGNSKKKQLNELTTYCKYEKIGRKFIIKEIYDKQIINLDTIAGNNKYIKTLSNIIIEYLYNNPKQIKEIPLSKLFVLLGITNNNYNSANYYRKELSQLYDIRLASIYYFYSNTKTEFKRIIERCLNNLKNRRVLNWYKVIMIKDENTKQIYKADKETEKFIIDTEKETLKYLKCNNMYEIIKDKHKLKEFTDIVYKETNINYFYAYDLVIGEKALKIEFDSIQEEKYKINKTIKERTYKMFNKDRFKFFINDYEQLNNLLIDIMNNNIDIKEVLKEKKRENLEKYKKDKIDLDIKYMLDQEELKNKYIDEYAI